MSWIWRCTRCIDCGEVDSEAAAAKALLKHIETYHPDPIAKWNHDIKNGAA